MLLLWLLLTPILTALSVLWFKGRYPAWLGFVGLLTGLIPISYGFMSTETLTFSTNALFSSTWAFHGYTLVGATSFTIVGAVLFLFVTRYLSKAQVISFCLALASALGITMARDFISLFLFWEALTVTTALIVLFDGPQNQAVGRRFLITHLLGGLALLFGILLHVHSTGSLAVVPPEAGHFWFLLGIGTKVGFLPLHFWIPATYATIRPSATVALSIFTTKAGILLLAKLFAGWEALAFMGLAMILFGIIQSLRSSRLTGILSYQHISQLGFMVVSIAAGGQLGVNGTFLHMTNHMVYKSLLFMVSALLFTYMGTESLHWKKQLPKPVWLVGLAAVGSFAIMGLPPFSGFVSKSVIKYASPEILQLVLSAAGIGTAVCFARFLYFGFWPQSRTERQSAEPSPINWKLDPPVVVSLVLLAGMTVLLGTVPALLRWFAPYEMAPLHSAGGALQAAAFAAIGVLLFVLFRQQLRPSEAAAGASPSSSWLPRPARRMQTAGASMLRMLTNYERSTSQLDMVQYIVSVFVLVILVVYMVIGRF